MIDEDTFFDVVVVGSSPLLLMYAIQARSAGKSVMVFEAADTPGGAWSINHTKIGDMPIVHEAACHLIEWYRGGYELLERLSGIPFCVSDPQPVKVWMAGRVSPYTSRSGIVKEYLLAWRSLAYSFIKVFLALVGVRYALDHACFQVSRAVAQLALNTRYRLPGVMNFDGVRMPEGGFTAFVQSLLSNAQRLDASIGAGRVQSVTRSDDGIWDLELLDGRAYRAKSVVTGESCEISRLNGVLIPASEPTFFHHILVGLPAAQTLIRNPYIHFADHNLLHRMSYVEDVRINDSRSVAIFLLQLRSSMPTADVVKAELASICEIYKFASTTRDLEIFASIEGTFLSSAFDSPWRKQKALKPITLQTIGDLSRNAVLNRHRLEHV